MSGPDPDAGVDLAVLAELLRAAGVGVVGDLSAERIGHGQSNLTSMIRDRDGRRWIARRPPRGELLASAHDVVREFAILRALGDSGVVVPLVIGCWTEDRLAPVPVIVMEYIDGLVVDQPAAVATIPTSTRRHIGLSMARSLASLHRVDIDAVGLGDLARRDSYADRQVRRWSRQWQYSKTRELPCLDEMTRLLSRSAPKQQEVSLVHGDFSVRNMIFDPVTGDVRGILDWELSTLGDPIADVGTMLAYWSAPGEGQAEVFPITALPGFVTRDELIAAYLEESQRSVHGLEFWHALGLWKLAVISEGVVRRAREDPRNASDGAASTASLAVDRLIDQAWQIVASAGLGQ